MDLPEIPTGDCIARKHFGCHASRQNATAPQLSESVQPGNLDTLSLGEPQQRADYHLRCTRCTVVRQLDLGHQREGYYTNRSRAAYWDGRNDFGERVATGIYFYQLEADNTSLLRKMLILK